MHQTNRIEVPSCEAQKPQTRPTSFGLTVVTASGKPTPQRPWSSPAPAYSLEPNMISKHEHKNYPPTKSRATCCKLTILTLSKLERPSIFSDLGKSLIIQVTTLTSPIQLLHIFLLQLEYTLIWALFEPFETETNVYWMMLLLLLGQTKTGDPFLKLRF